MAVNLQSSLLTDECLDGVIYVTDDLTAKSAPVQLRPILENAAALDEAFGSNLSILPIELPSKRLIISPIKKTTDYDDLRSFQEAANKGIKRALSAGVTNPLLVLPETSRLGENVALVTLLGALEALYVPIQLREDTGKNKLTTLHVALESGGDASSVINEAKILEEGRFIARDIGGGDPERMAAPKVQAYIEEVFKDSNISVDIIDNEEIFLKEYPLFAAVNRAASVIERHRGRIIYLRYEGEGEIKKTLYLVGKGITYDTGGADIKISGKMVGMSRDKCGAAAVAGFLKIVSRLKPEGLRVVGALALARNSVGENSYVADEVCTARSGARVRVGNTDAEGRMVMADVLCKLKEEALDVEDSQLITIATLTGHAALSVGPYTIAIDNSVAHKEKVAESIRDAGFSLADPFEVSILRREDFKKHAGRNEGDDVHQAGYLPSASSQRGHQGPTAFLVMSSGLDKHGLTAAKPLKYTHLDIAGSAGNLPDEPTGAPILALYGTYLLKK